MSGFKKQRHIVQETRTVDKETGEILQEKKVYSMKIKQDVYFMVYPRFMLEMLDSFASVQDIKLLFALCSRAEFNTNRVVLDKLARRELCELLDWKMGTFKNVLCRLRKTQAVIREEQRVIINPKIAWRGSQIERKLLIAKLKMTEVEETDLIPELSSDNIIQGERPDDFFEYRQAQETEFIEGFNFQVLEGDVWIDKTWNTACRKEYFGNRLSRLLEENKIRIKL